MRILVTGAAGMIGVKLVQNLAAAGQLGGRKITDLHLVDVVLPKTMAPGINVTAEACDLATPGAIARWVGDRPDVIFHLAAVVSAEAESDFEKGYHVNFSGTFNLFDAIRRAGAPQAYRPRVVFPSSLAVFGTPLPEVIEDDYLATPLGSYGTQKAIGELLVNDFSRRGFLDGVSLRLPVICVRPGKPNNAASGFFSSIIREPLSGQEAVLPVPDEIRTWHASPRAAVGFLLHAATIDLAPLGAYRTLNMPGVSASVGDQIEALRRVAGNSAVALIRREHDPAIERLVGSWPKAFHARRATALNFKAETSFDEIIRIHIEDELSPGSGRESGPRVSGF
ncbi:MAG: D-erythronate dehydrogenase [Rhodospirillaceae bacterium]